MNEDYIKIEDEIKYTYSYFIEYVQTYLSNKKTTHCISVASYGLYIIQFANLQVDKRKVALAGILHDLCRDFSHIKMIKKAEELSISITEYESKYPVLLHGPLAANISSTELKLNDPEIYEAIYWHTTGKANLGIVGQILYLSDFSEPLRNYPQAEETRKILNTQGFEEALYYAAQERFQLCIKKRNPSPYSIEFLNWLKYKRKQIINVK
ncbi:MAG TPA: bis(5'-nucleosyl)-tetraphosphatase (symmetrical) YqeK [Candidatus Hydrogenedens sp.]|nr:bis(5'-nucleosyl)-tetraphosphatase (symmetrical) YqeK [Candidatus Hydrogenedens sp.]